ncbi:hypothetical protein [Georgenia satyanarayanai]|uniref:hypothetical protein n=1 Tax=Georgenia satyanarayanai TaxID=860221 RepID=UPI0027BAA1D4|nr:hypothetical protein [Georgenia satyanarayanai]
MECLEGEVSLEHDPRLRVDYARSTPWTRQIEHEDGTAALLSLARPDGILVTGPLLHWPDGADEQDDVDAAGCGGARRWGCRACLVWGGVRG